MYDDFNPSEFECCDELDHIDMMALDLEFNDDGQGYVEVEDHDQDEHVEPDSISKFDSLVDEDEVDDVPF